MNYAVTKYTNPLATIALILYAAIFDKGIGFVAEHLLDNLVLGLRFIHGSVCPRGKLIHHN